MLLPSFQPYQYGYINIFKKRLHSPITPLTTSPSTASPNINSDIDRTSSPAHDSISTIPVCTLEIVSNLMLPSPPSDYIHTTHTVHDTTQPLKPITSPTVALYIAAQPAPPRARIQAKPCERK